MPPLRGTSWEDLPPEIIRQILAHVDAPSLLSLTWVNRLLNALAVEALLGPHVSRELRSNSLLFLHGGNTKQCILALCMALHLPCLSHISYHPFHESIFDLFEDLQGLHALIRKIQPGRLSVFELHLSVRPSEELDRYRSQLHPMELRKWGKLLGQVIDVALKKGCQHLEIEGTTLFPYRPLSVRPGRASETLLSWKRQLLGFLPWIFRKPFSTQLRSLKVAVNDFVAFPLVHYTTSIMQRSSRTLQKLEFRRSSYPHPRIPFRWNLLFGDAVRLSALNTLILFGEFLALEPHTLESFLSKHHTITDLKLDFSYTHISTKTNIPYFLDCAILPRMKSLSARPQLITWLLNRPSHSIRERRYPELEYVRILQAGAIYPNLSILDLSTVDWAILSLNDHNPSPKIPQNVEDDRDADINIVLCPQLTMCMNFQCNFWISWVRRHAESVGASEPSCLQKSRITRLKIELELYDESASSWLSQNDVTSVARWLGLFPLLRELEICSTCHPFPDKSLDDQLSQMINSSCPRLEHFRYNFGLGSTPRLLPVS